MQEVTRLRVTNNGRAPAYVKAVGFLLRDGTDLPRGSAIRSAPAPGVVELPPLQGLDRTDIPPGCARKPCEQLRLQPGAALPVREVWNQNCEGSLGQERIQLVVCRLNSDLSWCGWAAAGALKMMAGQRVELQGLRVRTPRPAREVRQAKALLWAAAEGTAAVGRIRVGRGRPVVLGDDVVKAIVHDTLHTVPEDGSACWSTRSMAARYGIGKDTVARIWQARRIRPWKVETFKLSTDPSFESKLRDVVGLYVNPPAAAAVFCFDEKTQVQALDRTQSSLPMVPRRGRDDDPRL